MSDLTPDEVMARAEQAFHFWSLQKFEDRRRRELENAMKRHGLVDVDAKAYARDLLEQSDFRPVLIGLRQYYFKPEEVDDQGRIRLPVL
jgi:hypothetical protein